MMLIKLNTDTDTDLSSDFDVDSVLTEESSDEFSDLEIEKATRVDKSDENKPMEYKDIVVNSEKTDTEKVLASSNPVVLKSESPVVLKSNSSVVNLNDVTVNKEDESATSSFRSSTLKPPSVPTSTLEIPVPPLSRSIVLKTMTSNIIPSELKKDTAIQTPKDSEIKIITDGRHILNLNLSVAPTPSAPTKPFST